MYTMGETARVMSRIDHPTAQRLASHAVDYLINTQRTDGGWGISSSTVEETGYAVLGLAAAEDATEITHSALAKAAGYLSQAPVTLTPLWIGKSLYCVEPLVPLLQTLPLRRIQQLQLSQQYEE
jgi:halimadienyl-diphosphate synthase